MGKNKIRPLAVTGIMSGLSFVLMVLEFPLPFIMPSFIQFDFSELPALITSFSLGPLWGVAVCLIKNLLHLSLSKTSGVGELANFLIGASFCFVSGLFYKIKKNRKGALLGCIIGALVMSIISFPINFFITYPFYFNFMPKETVINMYNSIFPYVDTLPKALIIFNLPFTFWKGIIDSLICFIIYKKISPIIKQKH